MLDRENQSMLMQRYDDDHNGRLGEDEFWYVLICEIFVSFSFKTFKIAYSNSFVV